MFLDALLRVKKKGLAACGSSFCSYFLTPGLWKMLMLGAVIEVDSLA